MCRHLFISLKYRSIHCFSFVKLVNFSLSVYLMFRFCLRKIVSGSNEIRYLLLQPNYREYIIKNRFMAISKASEYLEVLLMSVFSESILSCDKHGKNHASQIIIIVLRMLWAAVQMRPGNSYKTHKLRREENCLFKAKKTVVLLSWSGSKKGFFNVK